MHSTWSPVDAHLHCLATSPRACQAPTGTAAAAAQLSRLRLQARVPGRLRLPPANALVTFAVCRVVYLKST